MVVNNRHLNLKTAVPITLDLLTILALILCRNALFTQFQDLSAINAILIGGMFVLFCLSVYWLKKLEPSTETTDKNWIPAQLLSVTGQRILGILFGIALALAVAHQLGYMESIFIVDDRVLGAGESSAFFVYGPASWLGGGLIYMLVLSSITPPRFLKAESRYNVVAALGLLGVNLMLVLATAELQAVILSANVLWILGTFLILSVLFIPTRLVYLSKQPQFGGLISFVFLLLFAAWVIF
ncbi:MAG: hypothetical protein DWQ04_16945 [Chloroflexi bacterium]|nr:MAG: hypothetical protein DWQ04_16945 [Chloroflexota bacterium]